MSSTPPSRSVLVIGGGITGLAAAHRLRELDSTLSVTLLEAGPQLGGVLQTERRGEYLIERSADSFITNIPWGVDLCRRVGLAEELQGTDEARRRALVVCRGQLQPVPDGFLLMQPKRCWPVLASPILSLRGKLRLACEPLIGRREETSDESLASFVRRRLGREAFERLVQPLIGGIYTADPEKLSMAATLARFQELERRHGSLIRAAWREPSSNGKEKDTGARYSMFVAPREGLSSLVSAVAGKLPPESIRLNAPVARVRRLSNSNASALSNDTWQVELQSGEQLSAAAVIVAAPAPAAAKLLAEVDAALAGALSEIEYAGTSVVVLAVRQDQIQVKLTGFGFVVPAIERRRILAASFSSYKFTGRAPQDEVLIRVFVGGALQPELAALPDAALSTLVQEELAALIGLTGTARFCEVHRWRDAMPQYHVGHVERVARIQALAAQHPGLALAGNAYQGVGVPQCIHSGELAAENILLALPTSPAPSL